MNHFLYFGNGGSPTQFINSITNGKEGKKNAPTCKPHPINKNLELLVNIPSTPPAPNAYDAHIPIFAPHIAYGVLLFPNIIFGIKVVAPKLIPIIPINGLVKILNILYYYYFINICLYMYFYLKKIELYLLFLNK